MPNRYRTENRYAKLTNEEFDRILATIIDEQPASHLLTIPGVYELVSDHFNNDVLTTWDEEHDDEVL